MMLFGVFLLVGLAGLTRGEASEKLWFGTAGRSVALPCGNSTSSRQQCVWTAADATCDRSTVIPMNDVYQGLQTGFSAPSDATSECDLQVDKVDGGHEGKWTCRIDTTVDVIYYLYVYDATTPKLFMNGILLDSGASINLNTEESSYVFVCVIDRSRPAPAVAWELNSADVTASSSSVSYAVDESDRPQYHVSSVMPLDLSAARRGTVSCVVKHPSNKDPVKTEVTYNAAAVSRAAFASSSMAAILLHLMSMRPRYN